MGDGANHPDDRKYFKEHEWVRSDGGSGRVGLSAYAAEALGDIVFIELPDVGSFVTAKEACGEIESVKSVSTLHSPISGTVTAVNQSAVDSPELINSSPNDEGWLFEVEMSSVKDTDDLMSAFDYSTYIDTL